MQQLTSGVDAVDALIDGVRVGDNLVLVTSGDTSGDWLVDRLVAAAEPDRLVIVDATGRHARAGRATDVLDWSMRDGGSNVSADQARPQLAEADQRVGTGAVFVVESLSALALAWGPQAALDLFLWACPRLYRRRSFAVWLVNRNSHEAAFVRRLTDVTQVVVNVSATDGAVRLEVVKADGRPRTVVGRTIDGQLVGDVFVEAGPVVGNRRRFGDMLRELRVSRGVGQAELARRAGISPSALSQAERGVRGISADTLMRIWEILGVPFGADDVRAHGYRVTRRSTQSTTAVAGGVTGRRAAEGVVTVWQLIIAARAIGRQPLFPVKAAEIVTVVRGVLELDVGGRTETLHEGDALEAGDVAILGWANPSDTATEVMWIVGRSGGS
jgi:transcriptional regulator with XRE-family HTH domain